MKNNPPRLSPGHYVGCVVTATDRDGRVLESQTVTATTRDDLRPLATEAHNALWDKYKGPEGVGCYVFSNYFGEQGA